MIEQASPVRKRGGETPRHLSLKALAAEWAAGQGLLFVAPEVSFPHRRFRVDVAACAPTRKVPSRKPVSHLSSVLKAAVVFECKQVRGDLIRDNKRRALLSERLKTFPGDASEVGFDNYFYSGYQECVIKLSKIKGTDATDALKEIEWAIHADGGERERLDDAIAYQTKL